MELGTKPLYTFVALIVTLLISSGASAQNSPQFELTWGQCCSGNGNFSDPQDIAISPDGIIYVTDRNRVQLFSPSGAFIGGWDVPSASAISIDPTGLVYIATWDQIRKFSSSGAPLLTWGRPGQGNGEFSGVLGLAAGSNGSIYVADYGNYRVQQFEADSTFIRAWGEYGSDNGQFIQPSGVAIDGHDNVYVSDGRQPWIQKFTADGQFLERFDLPGSPDHWVQDVDIGPQNEIYVVELGHDRVEVLDSSGQFLFGWGTSGSGAGQFHFPMALGLSQGTGIFVVDYGNNRVEKFGYAVPTRTVTWGALKTRYR
jgi:sugar lactone lactonase YvrE